MTRKLSGIYNFFFSFKPTIMLPCVPFSHMAPASFFFCFFLIAVEKLVADQLPELGWRMAHGAAARGQDKKQHLERMVVPEKKGFDGWHAFSFDSSRYERQRLERYEAKGVRKESERQWQSFQPFTLAQVERRKRRELAQRLGQPRQRATAVETQRCQRRQIAQRLR